MIGIPNKTPTLQEAYDVAPTKPQIVGNVEITGNLEWDEFRYLTATTGGAINTFIMGGGSTNTGTQNIALGDSSLNSNTSGIRNVAVGVQTLYSNTTGHLNTAVGHRTLVSATTSNNTAMGYEAMEANTTGLGTAFGFSALNRSVTGFGNTAIGNATLSTATSSYNTAVGHTALLDLTTGVENVAFGYAALQENITGGNNLGIGSNSMRSKTAGDDNVAVGTQTLEVNLTGSENTVIGRKAGGLATGSGCVFIGFEAALNETGSNKLIIGNGASSELIYGEFDNDLVKINGDLYTEQGRFKNKSRATTTYTILVSDEEVFGNTDSAGYTATLPAGVDRQAFRIINTGSSGNDLTLAPNGSEHLLGVNSSFILSDGEAIILTYDATDGWY